MLGRAARATSASEARFALVRNATITSFAERANSARYRNAVYPASMTPQMSTANPGFLTVGSGREKRNAAIRQMTKDIATPAPMNKSEPP